MTDTPTKCSSIISRFFPKGMPRLWCPPLTHYRDDGRLDENRMSLHLGRLASHAKGWLVPGSTGDGWEMSDQEVLGLLENVMDVAARHNVRVLIGVLRTSVDAIVSQIEALTEWLCVKTGKSDPIDALESAGACGFTICPPAGAELSESEIHDGLAKVLSLGLPMALYQLPQVTKNEFSPATASSLAARFPNFFLLKDTSGNDHVALSSESLDNVFLVRGAEGNYAKWLKLAGGPYDGFLLSTANCFAGQYGEMIDLLHSGQNEEAEKAIASVELAVNRCFDAVKNFEFGNPFTNANKGIDHCLAYGPKRCDFPSPMLHCGKRLDVSIVLQIGNIMQDAGLVPTCGYLQ